MQKDQILKMQEALSRLLHQIENHQQSKTPILELNTLIDAAANQEKLEFRNKTLESLEGLIAAICDPLGLGKLNLMLKNAKVPPKYYDIFYEMLASESCGGGGAFEASLHRLWSARWID